MINSTTSNGSRLQVNGDIFLPQQTNIWFGNNNDSGARLRFHLAPDNNSYIDYSNNLNIRVGSPPITFLTFTAGGALDFSGNPALRSSNAFGFFTTANATQQIRAGSLLCSNDYDDNTLVPTNGAYIKGNVKIGDNSSLFLGATTRQMINLYASSYGIGIQDNTQYYRSDNRFSWFRGGTHSNEQNNSGGGAVAMTLDSSSNLSVTGDVIAFSSSDNRLKDNIIKIDSPLEKLSKGIDFEIFRNILEEKLHKEPKGVGGRRPYDYVLMFKILILQRYYNLSDDQVEYQINDRMSFMRFLNLTISDDIPDSKTVWNFREQMVDLDLVDLIFSLFVKELERLNLIVNEGKIVDASFIEVPKQRNKKEENQQIKNGDPSDSEQA